MCGVRGLNPSCFFQGILKSLDFKGQGSPWPPSCSRHAERDLPVFALIPLELQALAKSTAVASAAAGNQ